MKTNIQLENQRIILAGSKTKTGVKRSIDIPINAMAILQCQSIKTGSLPSLRFVERKIHDRAKLLGYGWPHDVLRDTGVSMMMQVRGDLGYVSTWAGNSPDVLKRHYLDMENVTKRDADLFYRIGLDINTTEQLKKARGGQAASLPPR